MEVRRHGLLNSSMNIGFSLEQNLERNKNEGNDDNPYITAIAVEYRRKCRDGYELQTTTM
uniref:Uncharacterized protein n=1 Tax=Loa loa TaxID=7209 RepID=A0A1I7VVZ9_LOALO